MEYERWLLLMERLGIYNNQEVYASLVEAYSEKHRYYHNNSHIEAVLKHLESTYTLADQPTEIEAALWFHDAIYKPFSSTNELDSANWAAIFLTKNGCVQTLVDRVHSLIMATLHTNSTNSRDEKLVVDIDLSILGCNSSVYEEFEKNVRKEYKWIPGFIYRKKRKEILNTFLNKERIYFHDHFHERLEEQARRNIRNTIQYL